MRKTIFFSFILLVILLLTFSITSAVQYTNSSAFENNRVKVTLTRIDPNPVAPGEYFDLYANFELNSMGFDGDLRNIYVSLVQDYPFSLAENEQVTKFIGGLKQGQTAQLKFRIKTDEKAVSGYNSLRFEYSSDRETNKLSAPLYINVRSRDSIVSVDKIKLDPEQIAPGSIAKLSIDVLNSASNSIRDVKLSIPLEGLPFATVNSLTEERIKRLNTGKAYTFEFDIVADPNAASAVYKLPLRLEYYDDANNFFAKNATFGVLVGAKPIYQMDIEDIDSHETNKAAKIVVSLSNIGPSDIKYATIKVLPSDNYEIVSQDRRYIGNLEPDDFETAEFQIYVKKQGKLKLELNYKDTYLHDYTAQEELELPIFSKSEAVKYGIAKPNGSFGNIILLALLALAITVIYKWVKLKNLPEAIRFVFKKIIIWIIRTAKILKPENLKKKIKELQAFIKKQ